MKHYSIKKSAALTAAFGMICFASILVSPSAWAQSGCVIIDGVRACPAGPEPGGSGGSGGGGGCPAPCDLGLVGDLFRGIFSIFSPGSSSADKTDQQAHAANEQGVQAYNKGDWATAITYFNQALQKYPNEPIYQKNLANAQANLANQQAKEKEEREAIQNKAAADNMQQSIQNFAQTLNAAPVSGGLDFGSPTSGSATGGSDSGGLDFTAATATPTSQLKGLSGTDNSGLKGSSTDAGAQLKSVERHGREAQLQGKDLAKETAQTGFDTPGNVSGNLVYTDKNQRQIPPSALDRRVPPEAQKDPQVQQSLAWYRKLDAEKAEKEKMIAEIKEQQKTSNDPVLETKIATLKNDLKRATDDQAKVTETVEKQVKNLGFNLVERPETTATEVNKK